MLRQQERVGTCTQAQSGKRIHRGFDTMCLTVGSNTLISLVRGHVLSCG
jgi:hypothetical protein